MHARVARLGGCGAGGGMASAGGVGRDLAYDTEYGRRQNYKMPVSGQ